MLFSDDRSCIGKPTWPQIFACITKTTYLISVEYISRFCNYGPGLIFTSMILTCKLVLRSDALVQCKTSSSISARICFYCINLKNIKSIYLLRSSVLNRYQMSNYKTNNLKMHSSVHKHKNKF